MADASDLLKADTDHIRRPLIANEEGGDRRVAFLASLATAVAAGLIALKTAGHADPAAAAVWVGRVVDWALISLLVVSGMIFLRILHRNRMSTHYQCMIDQAWALAAKDADWLRDAEDHKHRSPPARNVLHYIRGGHAVTVGAIIAILVAVLCRVTLALNLYAAVLIGVAAFVVLLPISLDRN
jgi:hypothetical protein